VARRIHNRLEKKAKRQELRNTATPAEATLWKHLQGRALGGKKFRRQHGIGPYIVDFYCPECRLVVELDGEPHFEFIADTYEAERAAYLEGLGITVLRFENRIVFESLDAVLKTIREEVERTTPPAPLRNGAIS
jgi:very-short-patch-repair endonuclease